MKKLKAKTASLEGERLGLRAELSSLQAQLEEGGRVHDNLQRVTTELDHTLSELESARTTAMLQQQEVRVITRLMVFKGDQEGNYNCLENDTSRFSS